ncbi:MAG: aminoglycoside phosphotransferase family protein [Bdellovibrionia bacterium]
MLDQLVWGEDEVLKWVKKSKTIESFSRLPGDASTRRYYRVASQGVSYIVMRTDPFSEQEDRYPFLVIQKHLKENQIDVPEVFEVDAQSGFLILEDLGDVTFLKKLQAVETSDTERHLYEKAIDQIVQLQLVASPRADSKPLEAFRLRFDFEKLMWEVNFTIENFYQIYLKRELAPKDLAILKESFSEICSTLANEPTVLTHRDFHSRNIMVCRNPKSKTERFVMIDFQDARMGPPQYDLASLLRDSYYQLDEKQIATLVDYYVIRWEAISGKKIDRGHFHLLFDLMSVQRNFKAIGSFASFMSKRGDPTYLKYIGNTFENIRRVLLKYPRYSRLREVLFQYYYF